jgi:putative ABC transport system substrate-binding protein
LTIVAVIVLAMAVAAEAQQARKVPLIGLLDYGAPDAGRVAWWTAFRQALQELGYVEGQSVAFEPRWAQGREDRLPSLAGFSKVLGPQIFQWSSPPLSN